jgi:hypothetical protein
MDKIYLKIADDIFFKKHTKNLGSDNGGGYVLFDETNKVRVEIYNEYDEDVPYVIPDKIENVFLSVGRMVMDDFYTRTIKINLSTKTAEIYRQDRSGVRIDYKHFLKTSKIKKLYGVDDRLLEWLETGMV